MNKYKCKDTKCERFLLESCFFRHYYFNMSRRDCVIVNCQLSTVNSYKFITVLRHTVKERLPRWGQA